MPPEFFTLFRAFEAPTLAVQAFRSRLVFLENALDGADSESAEVIRTERAMVLGALTGITAQYAPGYFDQVQPVGVSVAWEDDGCAARFLCRDAEGIAIYSLPFPL